MTVPLKPIDEQIRDEICTALGLLGVDPVLRGILASWGDSLEDEEILELLKEWNRRKAKGEKIKMD